MVSKANYEDKMLQLVYLGEGNLQYCQQISDFLAVKRKEMESKEFNRFINKGEVRYFVLVANNHFFEAISIIHSLVHEGNKQEISFKNYLKKNPHERLKKEIECIRKKYKEHDLDKLRNKIADHKNINNVGDPWSFSIILVNKRWIDFLSQIIKELKEAAYKYFQDSISNNYLYDGNALGEIMTRVFWKQIFGSK